MERTDILNKTIQDTEKAVNYLRVQNFGFAGGQVAKLSQQISSILEGDECRGLIDSDDNEQLLAALNLLTDAQEKRDYVLAADILESQLQPLFEDILQKDIINICDETGLPYIKGDYLEKNLSCLKDRELADKLRKNAERAADADAVCLYPEATNMGVNTLRYTNGAESYYFHSNVNPIKEGTNFANYFSQAGKYDYLLFGFGMGYHVEGFLKKDRRFKVTALECSLDVLTAAFMYRDLTDILNDENFELIFSDISTVNEVIGTHENFLLIIHYPSLRSLPESSIKASLNDYLINVNNIYSQKQMLDENYYFNVQNNDEYVDAILPEIQGKSVIFTAGGPSLADHFEYLRGVCERRDKVIVTAGTSYRKLVQNGIYPDFVIITDVLNEAQSAYIDGVKSDDTGLLYLCTAAYKTVRDFKGRRYIMLQRGYDDAEATAKEHGLMLIETGGSVSCSAIDLMLRLGCRELITMGLDLAFTDNKSHVFDNAPVGWAERLTMVKSVDGGTVGTIGNLNLYRKWVENRLKREKRDVSLINVSRGAYIEGMVNVTGCESI